MSNKLSIEVLNGDALLLFKTIEDSSVDLIIADPLS